MNFTDYYQDRLAFTPFTEKVARVLNNYPNLNIDGFYPDVRPAAWNLDKVERLCDFIRENYAASLRRNSLRGSYSLKHEIERLDWTTSKDKYVSNGELILAMLCEDHEPKRLIKGNMNCCFKVMLRPQLVASV
jgi:hypothetical protein